MGTASAHSSGTASVRLGPSTPGRTLLWSLRARLHGPWLDRDLAAGTPPWSTPLHAARSVQITSPRARRQLAESLDRIVARAQAAGTSSSAFSAVVPVDSRAVLGAQAELGMIAARLCDQRPINTSGVAALRDAISDGGGPFYTPLGGGGLRQLLRSIEVRLDVSD